MSGEKCVFSVTYFSYVGFMMRRKSRGREAGFSSRREFCRILAGSVGRCCLEDIVMGKLHELTIGLDICSTLHMDVSLDDLDWCQDQVMPANPAYLMALPTKNDPMLGYLTTAFQDHIRLREKYGFGISFCSQKEICVQ